MTIKKSEKIPSDSDERVKELMKDPVLKAHCSQFDAQGIKYKIIPITRSTCPTN